MTAPRRIELDGATNFRDYGGYNTPDGRMRSGALFRSDRLSRLTEADHARLEALNIALIIDLRRGSERDEEPTHWPGPEQWHAPIFIDDGRPSLLLDLAEEAPSDPVEASREMMRVVYRRMVNEPGPTQQFSAIFKRLTDPQAGVSVIHCSGGKDRTGLLAALVHTALGVHEDDVYQDFMLTAEYYDGSQLMHERGHQVIESKGKPLSEDALLPVFTVQADYLHAAFAEMERIHGSADGFLRHLSVDDAAKARLRENYLG